MLEGFACLDVQVAEMSFVYFNIWTYQGFAKGKIFSVSNGPGLSTRALDKQSKARWLLFVSPIGASKFCILSLLDVTCDYHKTAIIYTKY